jgi:hemolysin-activating ACP:hemolysin acyltransferase
MLFKSKNSKDEAKPTVKAGAKKKRPAKEAGGAGAKTPAKEAGAQDELSPEQIAEVRQGVAKSKQIIASFGGIVSLLMRTQQFKNVPLSSLEELVVPAVTTGQFMIAEAQMKKSGLVTPVAVVLWASVSEEIDQRLSDNGSEPVRLAPKDWKSGDIPWLIIAAGDKRLIKALLERIQETALKGRLLKFRSADKVDEGAATETPPN